MAKSCSGCLEKLDAKLFYRDRQKKDGLSSRCKVCMNRQNRTWRQTASGKAYERAYKAAHPGRPTPYRELSEAAKERARARARTKAKTERGKEIRKRAIAKYMATPKGRSSMKAAQKRYAEKYPEKLKARSAVLRAIRSGVLRKGPCERCGNKKAEAHHADYSKPLVIKWLCHEHHVAAHWAGK